MTPVFRWNALGAVDEGQFNGWQLDSQALVTAKIESTTPQARADGIDKFGLLVAVPDQNAPSSTLDWLDRGATPTTTSYAPYQSQIGLPGYVFAGLYHLGLTTISSLQIASSAMFASVLLLFAFLLSRITRRSFAIVFLVVALGSPWLALAGRNLYWVPWTWFLPACAAIFFVTSRGRMRLLAIAALAAAFLVRWASGFEYLTSVTLLAAAMPVLAAVFGRSGTPSPKRVARDVGVVVLVAFVCFVMSVVILAFLVGAGNFAYGISTVLDDAGRRTYGGGAQVLSGPIAESLLARPLDVVATYLFSWSTDVVSIGSGAPFSLVLGPNSFWLLVIGAAAVVGIRAFLHDRRWRRDAWLVAVALAVPLSWFVAAKGHSYLHAFINFVLFYLITVGTLIWVIGDALAPLVRTKLLALVRTASSRERTTLS